MRAKIGDICILRTPGRTDRSYRLIVAQDSDTMTVVRQTEERGLVMYKLDLDFIENDLEIISSLS